MKSPYMKLWGVVLLTVLVLSSVHGFIDRDHLRLDHWPAGTGLSRTHGVERDVCLCFSHGLFVPAFVLPAEHGWSFEMPVFLRTDDPLTLTKGEIFHPPLA